MGLLDKIFDKKECAICGGEIGLLGNRKLADGNLCKNCASKLSPFMTDRRESTVAEIREHLNYRAANARMLPGIHPTTVIGSSPKVFIDENQGKFFVTSASNWQQVNPDIIDVRQVIDCKLDVHESREQVYRRDREGRNVPYNPPRYKYEYRFNITILVDSPYFNEIRFELTEYPRPDNINTLQYRQYEEMAYKLQNALNPANYAAPAPQPVVRPVVRPSAAANAAPVQPAPAASWTCECGQVNSGKFCTNCGKKKPVVYRCDKCGWMPADLTKLPKFCPNCGDPFNAEDVQ